jgi:hypothetical protein
MKRLMKMNHLLLSALLMFNSCSQKPEPETYLIPKGFAGRVNIIFRRKDGTPPRYENNRRIYKIPANGILLTQFKDEYGLADHQYYFVDSNGKRIPLMIFNDSISNKDRDAIGIFLDGTTGQYGSLPNAVWWQEFVVSSYESLDNYFTPEYKRQFEDKLKKSTGVEVVIP